MGRGIFPIFQKYNETKTRWENIEISQHILRDYHLFSILNSNNGNYGLYDSSTNKEVTAIAEQRELPINFNNDQLDLIPGLSDFQKEYYLDDYLPYVGDINQSWLTGEEIIDYFHKNKNNFYKLNGEGHKVPVDLDIEFNDFISLIKGLISEHSKIRFVFGFDY